MFPQMKPNFIETKHKHPEIVWPARTPADPLTAEDYEAYDAIKKQNNHKATNDDSKQFRPFKWDREYT